MGQVRFSHAAETDLLEAWLSIAEDNPVAADGVLDAIGHSIDRVATNLTCLVPAVPA